MHTPCTIIVAINPYFCVLIVYLFSSFFGPENSLQYRCMFCICVIYFLFSLFSLPTK